MYVADYDVGHVPVILPDELRFRVSAEQATVEPYATATERNLNAQEDKREKAKFLSHDERGPRK
jgi:hypothetical protein